MEALMWISGVLGIILVIIGLVIKIKHFKDTNSKKNNVGSTVANFGILFLVVFVSLMLYFAVEEYFPFPV